LIFLFVVTTAACSYEEKSKTETAVEQAVDRFHELMNQEKYGDIYSATDEVLRGRTTEAEFTAQLRGAHEQLGRVSGKAIVIIDDSIWREFRKAFGSRREIVSHGNTPASESIIANERFSWSVENDQPRLLSYEFREVCKRPCAIGFGP
jgi:hypothetical protein